MVAVGAMAAACGHSAASPAAPTAPGATVSSIAVTSAPVSTASIQMTAMARLSDGSSQDVTRSAAWESSNPAVATVSPTGMLSVVGAGELDVRATYQSASGSMHLRVGSVPVSAVTITGAPAGASAPFRLTAMARLVDGSRSMSREAQPGCPPTRSWRPCRQRAASQWLEPETLICRRRINRSQDPSGLRQSSDDVAVTGRVVEAGPDARPVAGARVQILEFSNTTSDDRGAFVIRGVPRGRAIIEVSKAGYETWSNMLDLENDVDVTATLTPTAAAAQRTPVERVSSGSAR